MQSRDSRVALSPREIAAKILPSVVMVYGRAPDGETVVFGSGFLVRPSLVATNFHVVEDTAEIFVRPCEIELAASEKLRNAPTQIKVQKGLADKQIDIALLEAPDLDLAPLKLGDSNSVRIGDPVYVAGNPRGLEGTFTEGIVSGRRYFDGLPFLQISAPVSSGSSGGPVVNEYGEVIGIATFIFREGQNLNFAVPVSALKDLLINRTIDKHLVPDTAPIPEAKQINALFEKGLSLFNRKLYALALGRFKEVVRLDPRHVRAYIEMGRAYAEMERYEEELDSYQNALRIDPASAEALNNLGAALLQLKRYDEAVSALSRAISIKPDMTAAYGNLGWAYFMTGKCLKAIRVLQTAITKKGAEAAHYHLLGQSYLDCDELANAKAVYEKLSRLDPALAKDLLRQINQHQ